MNKIYFSKNYSFLNSDFSICLSNASESFKVFEVNDILTNLNHDKILSIPEYFKDFLSSLNIENNNCNYRYIFSRTMKNNYLSYLKEKITKSEFLLNEYFKNIFSKRKELLSKIVHLYNDKKKLDLPVYLHDTKTGRSRIIKGTNYLTMKKQKRSLLKTNNNKILYEIDFNSCEPTFYFMSVGKKINNDLYDQIKISLNLDIDRSKLKLAIISILYGASYQTVKRNSKISKDIYEKIKNYMEIDKFIKDHIDISKQNNMFYNFYKRPIFGSTLHNEVNYWVQSSAVDFAYLAFNDYAKSFKTFDFHAIIHDAMIFSIDEKEKEIAENTKFLFESVSNFKIPVKLKKLIDI